MSDKEQKQAIKQYLKTHKVKVIPPHGINDDIKVVNTIAESPSVSN